ncbi:MAG: DNA polymerase III subunit gamma/tau [Patescibacteria group bacterium]
MQIALYRKYRPGKFSELVGQEPIKLTLANQVKLDKIGHAYIFSGPKGTGKTTMARILAKAVNCLDVKEGDPCGECAMCQAADNGSLLDLIELDAASHRGIDNVKELIAGINTAPAMAKYKVFVIDEAHMLTRESFNALLKTLEEPPAHAIFILASTEVEKFPATIVSRCIRFDFRPIPVVKMQQYLKEIAGKEQIEIEDDALALIANQSGGGMRDALVLLDRTMGLVDGSQKVSANQLSEWFGWLDWNSVSELTSHVVNGEAGKAIGLVDGMYRKGFDLTTMARMWTDMVRQMLVIKMGAGAELQMTDEQRTSLSNLSSGITQSDLIWWLEQMVDLAYQVKNASVAQLPFEVMIVKVVSRLGGKNEQPPAPPVQEEPKAEVEVAPEPKPAPTPEVNLAEFDKSEAIELIQKNSPTLGAVLRNADWRLGDDKIVIGITSNFHKDKLEQPTTMQMVMDVLGQCGVNLRVEYKLIENKNTDNKEIDTGLISEVFG